jgi:hypothetical protein
MHNSPNSIIYPAISNVLVKSLYQENAVTRSSCLIGSEICDENGLGSIRSWAWTMHNSPSNNTYPAISSFLVKLLYWENAVARSSRLIGSEIRDENGLGSIQSSARTMHNPPSRNTYPVLSIFLIKSVRGCSILLIYFWNSPHPLNFVPSSGCHKPHVMNKVHFKKVKYRSWLQSHNFWWKFSMTKAAAWAAGFGFQLLWARPKPGLGRHQWPGLAWPKQAWLGLAHGFEPGQAHH